MLKDKSAWRSWRWWNSNPGSFRKTSVLHTNLPRHLHFRFLRKKNTFNEIKFMIFQIIPSLSVVSQEFFFCCDFSNFRRNQIFTQNVTWGGGGARLSCGRGVPLGAAGWPCLKPLSAQKIHPVTIYLTRTFICIPCTSTDGLSILLCIIIHSEKSVASRAPSLVPRSRACHKHCGPARTAAGAAIAGLS